MALIVGVIAPCWAIGSATTARAHDGHTTGLEFRLAVAGGGAGCSTIFDYKGNCVLQQGDPFVAEVYLDDISGIGNVQYDAVQAGIDYTVGMDPKFDTDVVWPDCTLGPVFAPPPYVVGGCYIGLPPAPSSAFTGLVMTAAFNCTDDGQLSLVHGPAYTLIIDSKGVTHTESGPDVLNIDCADLPPTPTRTPTPTPQPPVGGISRDASAEAAPAQSTGSSGASAGLLAGALAATTAGAIALSGGVRLRRMRRRTRE
jgi:hypothetical protein